MPKNVIDARNRLFRAIVSVAMQHDNPPPLIVNIDETGNLLVPISSHAFDKKGADKVPIVGADEKRATTLTFGVNMIGDMMPAQIIYAVKTDRTLPSKDDLPVG